jgi:hypothetical protein
VVTAVGGAVDASDVTATDVDTGDKLVLANQRPIAVGAPPPAEKAEASALKPVEATTAAASPTAPVGNVSCTTALLDPGEMATVTADAPGNCLRIVDRMMATSAVVSALANVI